MPRTKAGLLRSPSQRDRDRRVAARLYLRGESQVAIAEKLGVGNATVHRDLKHVREEWVRETQIDMGMILGRELARLQIVETEAWGAWDRSMTPRDRDGMPIIGEHGEEVLVPGDPAWLDRVLRCIERRCQLFGLDAPKRLHLSGAIEMEGPAPLLSVDERREALRTLLTEDTSGLSIPDRDNGDDPSE